MAQIDFLVYSDGKGDVRDWNFRSKDVKPIKEFTNRQAIQKVFIKDNAILYIANGNLWKEGYFNFEKIEKNDHEIPVKKEVYLKEGNNEVQNIIEEIVFGENHVLLLSANRRIYAWGDNYYGQLGLGNLMIPWTMEPQYIKMPVEIKKIFAYKNNSFAVDINDKLWVWGKNEFLGKNFRNNVFKPIQILNQYKVDRIFFNDNRVVVVASLQSDIKEKEREIKMEKEEEKKDTNKPDEEGKKTDDASPNEDAKSLNGSKLSAKEKDKSQINEEKKKPEMSNIGGGSQGIQRFLQVFDEGTETILRFLETKNIDMLNIRKLTLKDSNKIKEMGLEAYWDKIYGLINSNNSNQKGKINLPVQISIGDQINILVACLNSIMCGNFEKLVDDEKFLTYLKSLPKQINNVLQNKIEKNILKDVTMKHFYDNFTKMMNYIIRYKKIEVLTHRMAGISFMMKSFKFTNILEAIKVIQERDENVERKLYLINNSFKTIELLLEKVKNSFNNLNKSYEFINKSIFQDFENESELFIYKHIIEQTLHLFEVWNHLMISIKNEHMSQVKINQINTVLTKFKEVYSIYNYLSKTNLKNLIYEINKNDMKNIDMNKLKNKIALSITQIDGAIVKLDKILNERTDEKNSKHEDLFSKELILMLGTSVLDNAFLRKLIYSLIFSILQEKAMKEDAFIPE